MGAVVIVASELNSFPGQVEQTYVIAPPALMPASVVTAPVTPETTFVMPAWFGNRAVPGSSLGDHAEGKSSSAHACTRSGHGSEPTDPVPMDAEIEDVYLPQPDLG